MEQETPSPAPVLENQNQSATSELKPKMSAGFVIFLLLFFNLFGLLYILVDRYYYKWIPAILRIFGSLQAILLGVFLVLILPQLQKLYDGIGLENNNQIGKTVIIALIIISLAQIGFSFIVENSLKKTRALSPTYLITAAAFMFLPALFVGVTIISIFKPIYNLMDQVKNSQTACTDDAMICPDGSAVGRTGPNCSFAPCPTPTIDETANWKTYKSTYGYSLQYPSELELFDCKGSCNHEARLQNSDVIVSFIPSGLPLNKQLQNHMLNGFCKPNSNEDITSQTINNALFYRNSQDQSPTNICLNAVTQLSKTTANSYWILDIQANAYNQNGVRLFDQILSTFKFIDGTQVTTSPTVISGQWTWTLGGCGSSAQCSYSVCSKTDPSNCYSCQGKYDKSSSQGEKTPTGNEDPRTTTDFVCSKN